MRKEMPNLSGVSGQLLKKIQPNGIVLVSAIRNCNAGLSDMEDESLPIEDVVHMLELEEFNADG